MRADGIEDLPAEGRPRQKDRREGPPVGLHQVAKALRRARNHQQQEARLRKAEFAQDGLHLLVIEIVWEDYRHGHSRGGASPESAELARAV
jgi:hypothetical protein